MTQTDLIGSEEALRCFPSPETFTDSWEKVDRWGRVRPLHAVKQ